MSRQYTTIGMSKSDTQRGYFHMLPGLLWALAIAGSRVFYLMQVSPGAADPHGYFANAMIEAGKSVPQDTWPARVYTESLSVLFKFTGNRIEAACGYQMVLQVCWLLLLSAGLAVLFGKLAGIISVSVLAVLPVVFESMAEISPENFFLFLWSFVLGLLGMLLTVSKRSGRFKAVSGVIYLLLSAAAVMPVLLGAGEKNMEISLWPVFSLSGAVITGVLLQAVILTARRKKNHRMAEEQLEEIRLKEEKDWDDYVITEDGRKIKLLDNPLPVPKKHVKKEIEFDMIDEIRPDSGIAEFDFQISEEDDFDL